MAEEINTEKQEKNSSLIDPVYRKFMRGVVRAIGSTDFYEFFMDSISRAKNEFQFSNRKLIKTIDLDWVDAIEDSLEAMQNIISSPRNIIKEEELIVNVANAKRAGAETVRHLAQHSSLVEDFNPESGDVRPGRLMQRYREDSIGLYENRLVFTTMELAHHFVKVRYDALCEAMSDEYGAKLKINSDMDSATEHVHMDMFLHIKEIDSILKTDEKHRDVFNQISRMNRVLSVFMSSQFAQQMKNLPRVKGSITKTNVLKKNKDYQKIVKTFEFIRKYDEIGYTVRVVEQNPMINEELQQNIFHNIMFNYLILKGYLEDESSREIPTPPKGRKRKLKPRFIREIIEELTEDYDLPDVEIRKVLIEELTKEQLMQEEASERLRLVEEQEQRRKAEEAEKAKAEEAEAQRLQKEKEAEEERIRLEKEAEEQRIRSEIMEQKLEDRRRSRLFKIELEYFNKRLIEKLEMRNEQDADEVEQLQDYEDAVKQLEHEEQQRIEEEARRIREEEERLARIREREELQAKLAQREKDMQRLQPYVIELSYFLAQLDKQLDLRTEYEQLIRQEEEERKRSYRERQAKRSAGKR